MKIIFDACTFIGVVRSSYLEQILALSNHSFCIGPLSLGECDEDIPLAQSYIDAGRMEILDDSTISADVFARMLRTYRLGDGETECLAFASCMPLTIATDDKRARKAATKEFGPSRVIGSIGLLKRLVDAGTLSPSEGFGGYQKMIALGSYTLTVDEAFFHPTPVRVIGSGGRK